MPKSMLHLCIIVSRWPVSTEVSWLSNSTASLMASIKISQIVSVSKQVLLSFGFTYSLYFLQSAKKWIIATYLSHQSKDQFNYWSKWVNMKRWNVWWRRSTCCQYAIMKSEYAKFVMHKKTMLIFLCNTKMKFYFLFWYVVIILMLCNNKSISPWHYSFKSRKQKFGVAEKNFMFKTKLMLHKN